MYTDLMVAACSIACVAALLSLELARFNGFMALLSTACTLAPMYKSTCA